MNILLDAQPLLGAWSGIARYVHCLHEQLSDIEDLNVSLAFNRLIKDVHLAEPIGSHVTSMNIVNNRYPYKVIRRLTRPNKLYSLPYDLFSKHKADIFHGTNFTYTPILKGKTVITIHDLAYMLYPESTSQKIYNHHTNWVPYSAQHCDRIIADSHQTKKDIMELLHIHDNKIDVIHLAADSRFIPTCHEQYESVLKKHDLPERYILFVGTLEPRKNLLGLLKAFNLIRKNTNSFDKLVIVGGKGWKYSSIFDYITKEQLENDVIFTGFIDDSDLCAIYNGASVFVMPSIYEGFGLPILEAMNCGIPVVGSDVSSIQEIIGEYGVLIPPNDHELWAETLIKIMQSADLRLHYSELSLQRSTHFSWQKVALETYNTYKKVLS